MGSAGTRVPEHETGGDKNSHVEWTRLMAGGMAQGRVWGNGGLVLVEGKTVNRLRSAAFFAVLGVVTHCSLSEPVSNTGYIGTWARGSRVRSVVSIYPKPQQGYHFQLLVDSSDGSRQLRCDWAGECEEFVYGKKTRRYRFRTRLDPQTGQLLAEYDVYRARTGEHLEHYVDAL